MANLTDEVIAPVAFDLLPPPPGVCPCCAADHGSTEPHDATTLFYSVWFRRQSGRPPTWADAMTHCPVGVREAWTAHLTSLGIDVNSVDRRGGIITEADLECRIRQSKTISINPEEIR
jgi:hypothetical protein